MCVYDVCAWVQVHVWKPGDNFWELILSSIVGSRDWTQLVRLLKQAFFIQKAILSAQDLKL